MHAYRSTKPYRVVLAVLGLLSVAMAISNVYALNQFAGEQHEWDRLAFLAFVYSSLHLGVALLCVFAYRGSRISRNILEIYLILQATLILWERLPDVYQSGSFNRELITLIPFLLWAYFAYVLRREDLRAVDG